MTEAWKPKQIDDQVLEVSHVSSPTTSRGPHLPAKLIWPGIVQNMHPVQLVMHLASQTKLWFSDKVEWGRRALLRGGVGREEQEKEKEEEERRGGSGRFSV